MKRKAKTSRPVITHGFMVSNNSGGVRREVRVHLFNDGSYGVTLLTTWNAVAKPIETRLRLSPETFSMLFEALFIAAHDMYKWPAKQEPTG